MWHSSHYSCSHSHKQSTAPPSYANFHQNLQMIKENYEQTVVHWATHNSDKIKKVGNAERHLLTSTLQCSSRCCSLHNISLSLLERFGRLQHQIWSKSFKKLIKTRKYNLIKNFRRAANFVVFLWLSGVWISCTDVSELPVCPETSEQEILYAQKSPPPLKRLQQMRFSLVP